MQYLLIILYFFLQENRGAETLIKEVDNYVSAVLSSDSDQFTYPQEFIHDNIGIYANIYANSQLDNMPFAFMTI